MDQNIHPLRFQIDAKCCSNFMLKKRFFGKFLHRVFRPKINNFCKFRAFSLKSSEIVDSYERIKNFKFQDDLFIIRGNTAN